MIKCLHVCIITLTPTLTTMKLWHWKSHWHFSSHWNNTEITLKITKATALIITLKCSLYCSRTLKSHSKCLNNTEQFSALLICFVPRIFSVTLDFQCDFYCHSTDRSQTSIYKAKQNKNEQYLRSQKRLFVKCNNGVNQSIKLSN